MNYKKILVTGGAGFVGSNVCLKLREEFPDVEIIALDNLSRKGSELNVPRLESAGVVFRKADVRNKKDLEISKIDLIIECSAEPSVMAGVTSSPQYLLETNLIGAVNCFELARTEHADVIFLSTSRVYPIEKLNSLASSEEDTRFVWNDKQDIPGASSEGISEEFPLDGVRSLYGATKLSAEFLLPEYSQNYGIKTVINRCGLLSGPWQMGKMDQGIIAYWVAAHVYGKPLSYIGYGGMGKQVRDVLHIDDLYELISLQMKDMGAFSGKIYNAGGGRKNSVSLQELTAVCKELSGKTIEVGSIEETRPGDIRIYVTDNKKITTQIGWAPKKSVRETTEDVYKWITENKQEMEKIFL